MIFLVSLKKRTKIAPFYIPHPFRIFPLRNFPSLKLTSHKGQTGQITHQRTQYVLCIGFLVLYLIQFSFLIFLLFKIHTLF